MKANKLASKERKKAINANPRTAPRISKKPNDRKEHDTKGKDTHSRRYG